MKKILSIFLILNSLITFGAKYFVAPNGNDTSGAGTLASPYFSLVKAWSYVSAGDTIYMRGGTYEFSVIQTLSSRSGTSGSYIKILPYQLEKPILTRAETITGGTWPMALVRLVSSDYVQIKGLEITGFVQDTILASICSGLSLYLSDNCIIEQINSHHNGHGILIYQSGDNQILNCDTHHNYDPIDPFGDDGYGDGDGLEVSDYGAGTWTIIRGHRSWNNSDDGIDLWDSQKGVTIEDSWAWNNGYREDGVTIGGDGNGFKLGRLGNLIESYTTHLRTIQNNVAFNNRQTGFNQNDTRCIIRLYNNTSYGNPVGYQFFTMGTAINTIRNNISFNNTSNGTFHSYDTVTNNTFLYTGATNTAYTVTNSDFASIDSTGCSSIRQLWGEAFKLSFLRLVLGSDLIDAGYDVGIDFYNTAPDIGAYEYDNRTALLIENQNLVYDSDGGFTGYDITRTNQTNFTWNNNYLSSVNLTGYMLIAGNDASSSTNHNLDGEIIEHSVFNWNGDGAATTIATHGVMTGYMEDAVIRYNRINRAFYGIIKKSGTTDQCTDVDGVIAYNVIVNPEGVAINVKGHNGVRILNNTIYSNNTTYVSPGNGTWRGLIHIYQNTDASPYTTSHDTKIYNNIFYTVNQIYNIYLEDTDSKVGFESDYNIYYCEAGTPLFRIASTTYTFSQWQALGYDTHSTVIDPQFDSNFIPESRLDYGINLGLGSIINNGLDVSNSWSTSTTDGVLELQEQDENWQVGAYVLGVDVPETYSGFGKVGGRFGKYNGKFVGPKE